MRERTARTAIQLYRALADALKSELDAQPDAETRAIFAEVTRGSEELIKLRRLQRRRPPRPQRTPSHGPSTVTALPAMCPANRCGLRRMPFPVAGASAILAGVLIVRGAFISYRSLRFQAQVKPSSQKRATSATQAGGDLHRGASLREFVGDSGQEFFSDA